MLENPKIRERLFFCTVCVLCVFRVSYLGFSYTPYLDDYVQYFHYPSFENPWRSILWGGAKTAFTRPLAAFCDLFVWSAFSPQLGLAVAVISLLFGLSAVLFFKAFSAAGFEMTPVFLAAYAFVPLNIEGVYWLSASSRVAVSLFLSALSCFFLMRGRNVLFAVFCFLSMWFYEQTAILSFFAVSGLILMERKRLWRLAVPTASALALAAYYLLFGAASDNAERLRTADLMTFFPNAAAQLKNLSEILFSVHGKIISRGFVRGIARIAADRAYIWLAALTVLCALLPALFPPQAKKRFAPSEAVFGASLAAAAALPFFLTAGNLPNVRSAVPIMVGAALVLDSFLPCLLRSAVPLLVSVCLFAFTAASVSEVCDYERTAQADLHLARSIAAQLPSDSDSFEFTPSTPKYYPQNAPLRDHIVSMTGTDWGVTGIVRAVSGRRTLTIDVRY